MAGAFYVTGWLDEIALHSETEAVRLSGGRFGRLTIAPEQAGLQRRPAETLKGGGPEENAGRLKALSEREGTTLCLA